MCVVSENLSLAFVNVGDHSRFFTAFFRPVCLVAPTRLCTGLSLFRTGMNGRISGLAPSVSSPGFVRAPDGSSAHLLEHEW